MPEQQSSYVKKRIEDLRNKLLDLSLRNKLIQFRHNARHKTYARLVDTSPDLIFDRLCKEEKECTFRGLSIEAIHEDEETEEFQKALKSAKRQDEEYLGERAEWEAEESPSQVQETRIERRLRDRVRASLGMKPITKAKIDPVAFAVEQGIDPSYDLTKPTSTNRSERQLQTLYTDTELNQRLKKIEDQYNSSIQERGINTLYLAIGFLEWTANESSSSVITSPLILLRLELEKKKPMGRNQDGKREACIRAESNETIHNASLAAKLKKDFRYNLPERKEEEGVEAYFKRVEKSIPKSKDWKVRRFATVCHLSFQKITLYEDLGPDRWKEQPLHSQKLLRDIISGARPGSTSGLSYSEDYSIDELPDKELVDLLVRDADSSQHSALVDALDGKNLVIEGPPGTGKSQTITNLIAACMHRGKSVLFVAEKLAALQVVKNRLDDCKCRTRDGKKASLGNFCLELHSNKVRRSAVHGAMKRRLDLSGKVAEPRDYEFRREQIWAQREKMKDFLDWLHTPVGSTELTFFQIIWGESNTSDNLGQLTKSLNPIYLENSDALKPKERAQLKEAAAEYAAAYRSMKASCEGVEMHPWLWVKNVNLGKYDAEELYSKVLETFEKIGCWRNFLNELSAAFNWPTFVNIAAPLALREQLLSIPIPDIDLSLLPRLRSPEYASSIEREMLEILSYRKLMDDLRAQLKEPSSLIGWQELPDLIGKIRNEPHLPTKTQAEMQSEIDTNRSKIEQIESIEQGLEKLSCLTEGSIAEMTLSEINLLEEVCSELIEFGDDLTALLTCGFADLSARNRWALFFEEWKLAKARTDENAEKIASLDGLDSRELRTHAAVLREAGFFQKLFSKEVKKSKNIFRSIYVGADKLTIEQQSELLIEAAATRELVEAVERNKHVGLLPDHLTCSTNSDLENLNNQLVRLWKIRHRLSQCAQLKGLWENLASVDGEKQIDLCNQFSGQFVKDAIQTANTTWQNDQNVALSALKVAAEKPLNDAEKLITYADRIGLLEDQRFSDLREIISQLEKLLSIKRENGEGQVAEIIGSGFSILESDLSVIRSLLDYKESVDAITYEGDHRTKLFSGDVRNWLGEVKSKCESLDDISKDVDNRLRRIYHEAHGLPCGISPKSLIEANLNDLEESLAAAMDKKELLFSHLSFIYCSQTIEQLSASKIIESVRNKTEDVGVFEAAIDYVFYRSILKDNQRKQELKLSRNAIEGYQKQFRELDKQLQELTIQNIISGQGVADVPRGVGEGPRASWTGLSLVELEANKQKRHLPLRRYLSSAGDAVRALMPCMMMSPQTVAEFLEPAHDMFDIVIIDEASQMRPEEAISALARGKQLVVVGDDKQLPPSSFFMANEETTEDEDEEDNAESILEMAAITFEDIRRLRWHYRSRHDSLIHFSNHEFYDGQLVVFPSPVDTNRGLGITYHYSTGHYHEGLNESEAEMVVKLVVDLMAAYPTKSIGVATMNSKQRELLFDEISKVSESNSRVSHYISKWEDKLEYFFVKNLENVQGDERDIIIVSTVYGPSEGDRKVSQNFGPINKQYGHRRLNVLFTRAKEAIHLVTSLKPSDIKAGDSSQRGVKVLQEYLQYATDGHISKISDGHRNIPDNDFERSVGRALTRHGYDITYQVGSSGYYIDIGVKHPNGSERFIMAVECDGAPFHSSKSARDRDRLRQEQLERLGWKFHRIWSTDWYRARAREEKTLIEAVKNAEAEYEREQEAIRGPFNA
jgi:very-short-patch-repair endonuclease